MTKTHDCSEIIFFMFDIIADERNAHSFFTDYVMIIDIPLRRRNHVGRS